MNTDPALHIDEAAVVSPDARIYPSVRGTRIRIGPNTRIDAFAIIRCVGGTGDIVIGANCFINPHCVLYSGAGITIGNDVLLAPGVQVVPANHEWSRRDVPIRSQGFRPSKGGVLVEDDVWVGANSVILDGARVRKGAIVAAGSVVVGEIPAYQIWGGNPAVKMRDRP